jgi:glycosyltransferase involved in cell wall biosynthesis
MRRVLKSPILGKQEYLSSFEIPASDGLYEAIGADVLHITYPLNFVRSSVPTVITMHDLQHRHLPELFPLDGMRWRECTYPQMFRLSRAIITVSRFCKEDIVKQYGVPASKIYVIPLAAPIGVYARPSAETKRIVINKYQLPQDFMLYPAMTYEHKNHVRLLQAIALLRAEGIKASLVCTGAQFHHWPVIRQTISELRLERSVQFLGFVDASDLTALYELAQFIVLPSLFEGAGLPLLEAFKASRAVACSDIAAFREYGGDAPLFFDARAPRSIADAIRTMVGNADLRVTLAARGARQGAQYNWCRTAGLHRAVYRKVAGLELSSEENQLLSVA